MLGLLYFFLYIQKCFFSFYSLLLLISCSHRVTSHSTHNLIESWKYTHVTNLIGFDINYEKKKNLFISGMSFWFCIRAIREIYIWNDVIRLWVRISISTFKFLLKNSVLTTLIFEAIQWKTNRWNWQRMNSEQEKWMTKNQTQFESVYNTFCAL